MDVNVQTSSMQNKNKIKYLWRFRKADILIGRGGGRGPTAFKNNGIIQQLDNLNFKLEIAIHAIVFRIRFGNSVTRTLIEFGKKLCCLGKSPILLLIRSRRIIPCFVRRVMTTKQKVQINICKGWTKKFCKLHKKIGIDDNGDFSGTKFSASRFGPRVGLFSDGFKRIYS